MKSWKKRWKTELDSIVPELNNEVKKAPIVVSAGVENQESPVKHAKNAFLEWFYSNGRGVKTALVSLSCAIVMVLCVSLAFFIDKPKTQNVVAFAVEINPKAVFTVNEDGVVDSVTALNTDADIILSSNERLSMIIGKSPEEACSVFVDFSAKLGFIDLSKKGAIKISGCGAEVLSVVSQVESYFKNKGSFYAVVSEKMELTEFCEISGTFSKNINELTDKLRQGKTLFSERIAEGKTEEQLKTLFEENFKQDDKSTIMENSLKKIQQRINEKTIAINAIWEKSQEIIDSEDNPNKLLPNYWAVKENIFITEYTESFEQLMKEMEGLLSSYEQMYGESIDDYLQLVGMVQNYTAEKLEFLNRLVEEFNLDAFLESWETVNNFFLNIGENLEELVSLPTSFEEYFDKTKDYLLELYESKVERFSQVYGEVREKISDTDYNNYINNVIAEYGSLENYWKSLNA